MRFFSDLSGTIPRYHSGVTEGFVQGLIKQEKGDLISLEAFRLCCVRINLHLLEQSCRRNLKRKNIYDSHWTGHEFYELSNAIFNVFNILDLWIEDYMLFANDYKYESKDGTIFKNFIPTLDKNIKYAKTFCESNQIPFQLSVEKVSEEYRIEVIQTLNFNKVIDFIL